MGLPAEDYIHCWVGEEWVCLQKITSIAGSDSSGSARRRLHPLLGQIAVGLLVEDYIHCWVGEEWVCLQKITSIAGSERSWSAHRRLHPLLGRRGVGLLTVDCWVRE